MYVNDGTKTKRCTLHDGTNTKRYTLHYGTTVFSHYKPYIFSFNTVVIIHALLLQPMFVLVSTGAVSCWTYDIVCLLSVQQYHIHDGDSRHCSQVIHSSTKQCIQKVIQNVNKRWQSLRAMPIRMLY